MLDPDALQRSVARMASPRSLSPLFARLSRGEPISFGLIGASVAQNGGCLSQSYKRCFDYRGVSRVKMAWGEPRKRKFKGWAVRFLEARSA